MADRYFVAEPIAPPRARLIEEEAHHLAHVMRARAGDEVTLFDGGGAEWHARVTRVGRGDVELELLERRGVDRELPLKVTLAVALPKGDRQRSLVEKAVELGVDRLQPLVTERAVAQPVEKALIRLRRAVIEASKQCGRNRLMQIADAIDFVGLIELPLAIDAVRAIADPSGRQSPDALLAAVGLSTVRQLTWLIGPEGGLTEQELQRAQSHGWPLVSLGSRTLRVETAAIYLAAISAEHCPQSG